MDKQKIENRVKEAVGKIKEDAGKSIGNKHLEDNGILEKNMARIQSKNGDLESDIENDLEDDEV